MGVLKVKTGGIWQEVAGTPAPIEEVYIGPTDPYITDPLSVAELWFEPTNSLLYARVAGVWELVSGGVAQPVWVFSANATGAVDPGLGNLTAVSDGATPPIWTFEVSAVDAKAFPHNLSIIKPGDTIVITDVPTGGGVATFYQRFSVLTEPTDNIGWYTFTAEPADVAIGTLPAVGSEIALDLGFGGGAVKVLDDLTDVQTLGLTTHPTGPAPADVLHYNPDGGGPGIAQWVPGPDTHVVFEPVPVTAEEPTLPDGTGLPTGSLWLSPTEVAPIVSKVAYLPLTGGTVSGPTTFQDTLNVTGVATFDSDVNMGAGDKLMFPQETGDKIVFYPPSGSQFKVGVESGELRFTVDQVANRVGFFVGGTERARITQDGVIAMGTAGLHLGDKYHGWAYDTAYNGEHLRSYQAKWAFQKTNGSVPGTKVAEITEGGIWTGGSVTSGSVTTGGINGASLDATSHIQTTGSTESNSSHLYVNAGGSTNPWRFKVLEARLQDLRTVAELRAYRLQDNGTNAFFSELAAYTHRGGWGYAEIGKWTLDTSDGQRIYYNNDYISSTHFEDRCSMVHKMNPKPVDPAAASKLIDALEPITYLRRPGGPPAENAEVEQKPYPLVSIAVEQIEASGVLVDELLSGQGEDRSYSLGGLLAVAIKEIQNLRARVSELESGSLKH